MPRNSVPIVTSDGRRMPQTAAISRPPNAGTLEAVARRALDVAGASVVSIAVLPILVCAALALWISGIRPVLFRQERVGLCNRPFTMLKFRTLYVYGAQDPAERHTARSAIIAELNGVAEPDPQTGLFKQDTVATNKVGEILRRYSIDELPQLWNVLRGEMSLVGPRPALLWEAELFSTAQQRRHLVKPGMTGLWQVSGRNALNTAQMLALDIAYVESNSIWVDLGILVRTPSAVLRKLTR